MPGLALQDAELAVERLAPCESRSAIEGTVLLKVFPIKSTPAAACSMVKGFIVMNAEAGREGASLAKMAEPETAVDAARIRAAKRIVRRRAN